MHMWSLSAWSSLSNNIKPFLKNIDFAKSQAANDINQ